MNIIVFTEPDKRRLASRTRYSRRYSVSMVPVSPTIHPSGTDIWRVISLFTYLLTYLPVGAKYMQFTFRFVYRVTGKFSANLGQKFCVQLGHLKYTNI
jgi:hypothetical protein